jgi:hypothetical protein
VTGQDGNLGPFTMTSALETAGGAYVTESPTLCASKEGFLFVVGGAVGAAKLDTILVAKINPTTGMLGTWMSSPQITKLETPLLNARCFVENQRLFVLGGEGATSRTDVVTSIAVNADGTLGATWTKSDSKLGFPRSAFGLAVGPVP